MPQRPLEIETVTFFPEGIPTPKVEGPIEMDDNIKRTRMDDGSVKKRMLRSRGTRFFLYTWENVSPRIRQTLEAFVYCKSRLPLKGWTNPGETASYMVTLSDVRLASQHIVVGQSETCTLEVAAFILGGGDADEPKNRQ